MFKNFTVSVVSLNSLVIEEAAGLYGPRIGVFADNVQIIGKLNSTGNGCLSDQGLGAGTPGNLSLCGGGGASYSGNGGIAQPLNSSITQNECKTIANFSRSYGVFNDFYMYEGSGGGSIANSGTGGRGGGIVWLQGMSINMTGSINSNGNNATE